MTGEDMIIEVAAQLLREAKFSDHAELRKVFWIAGRCEHCGAPTVSDGKLTCIRCGRPIVNRCSAAPRDVPSDAPRWVTMREWEEQVGLSERENRLWLVLVGEGVFAALWGEARWDSVVKPRGTWAAATFYPGAWAPLTAPSHVLIPGRPER